MTPADNLAEAVEKYLSSEHMGGCEVFKGEDCDCHIILNAALAAYHAAKPDEAYQVTIHGQYDADSHCVLTTHGEVLVTFETDAGSLAPLDGKAVSVTIQATETNSSESKEPK